MYKLVQGGICFRKMVHEIVEASTLKIWRVYQQTEDTKSWYYSLNPKGVVRQNFLFLQRDQFCLFFIFFLVSPSIDRMKPMKDNLLYSKSTELTVNWSAHPHPPKKQHSLVDMKKLTISVCVSWKILISTSAKSN